MAEFADDGFILLIDTGEEFTLEELLPSPFRVR
jgi:hypothetical protein